MKIKESSSVTENYCIKWSFEGANHLSGSENLKETMSDRTNYIERAKVEELEVLRLPGLNSWKDLMISKNYVQYIVMK